MRYTFYQGSPRPIVIVGRNACNLASFAEKYRTWHSIGNDKKSKRALASCVKRDAVIVNEFGQFKWHC
jgi:hypothetical protein